MVSTNGAEVHYEITYVLIRIRAERKTPANFGGFWNTG